MNKFSKALYYLFNKPNVLLIFLWDRCARIIPDKLFLSVKFRLIMGYWMDFNNPQTYNEKIQWLKLNYRHPGLTRMVDKVDAKNYVSEVLTNDDNIIPTIGVYNNLNEIEWNKLPEQFVIKCTHGSGDLLICRDRDTFDVSYAKTMLGKYLKRNYYWTSREWPYKNVKPRIIVEKYMEDESGYELKDYKWFCFNGEPKLLFIATDRNNPHDETKFDFYDSEFNHIDVRNGHPNSSKTLVKPRGFEEMKRLASKLSEGHPHLRVDFYDVNGKVYFGELTFFHWGGFVPFEPQIWDKKLGAMIDLSKVR